MLIEITYNVTDVYMSTTETPVYVEISFEQPGGTSAVWGSITGTLSNQTDLQTALDLKLDESTIDGGAEGQILSKASATDFDFAWINNYAKYLATNVRNQTGSTIAAFRVVYISGATGNKPLVSLADADTEATSSKTYGVTSVSIANNGTGDVVTAGELSGIDTSAFNEGDSLWLSSTAGQVQTTPPAEPAHTVFIGTVIRSHPTLGVIDVAIQNGYELNELHGVEITAPANNDGLFYNGSLWVNKSIATVLGYTPANAATTLTINGVTYDLSANRSWTISAGISGSGASGQVTYWTGASAVSGSSNFIWNNTTNLARINGGLGINRDAFGGRALDILGGGIRITGSTSGSFEINGSDSSFNISTLGGISGINITDSNNAIISITGNSYGYRLMANASLFRIRDVNAGSIDRLSIFSTGNVGIGTTTDNGARLQVSGNVTFGTSGTGLYWDNTNARLGIGTNAPISSFETFSNTLYIGGAFSMYSNTATDEPLFYFRRGRGTLASPLGVQAGDVLGSLRFALQVNATVGNFNTNAKIESIAESTGANLRFYTNNSGLNLSPTCKLQISGNGNVLIQNGGTFTDNGARLQVSGNVTVSGQTKIGNTVFADTTSQVILGVNGTTSRGTVASDFTFQDFQFVNTSITSGNINGWSFGQRRDTAFGNALGSFQIVGGYISNSGVYSSVGGGYRVPLICNPNGDVLILGGNANVVNGLIGLKVNAPTAHVDVTASTTSNASLRIRSGTAPTTPNDGDIWFDGTDIKMRIGGVTKTFTLV